jgi:CheY-like chemotaxis protein
VRAPTVTILLADDNKVDVMAVRRWFRTLRVANPVIEAQDGLEALDLVAYVTIVTGTIGFYLGKYGATIT